MTNFVKFHLMASPDMSTPFYVWEKMLDERAVSNNIPPPPVFVASNSSRSVQNSAHVNISCLWTYDLYSPIRNAFDAGKSITRASGRGLGPENRDFLGPWEMALSLQASTIWGLKKSKAQILYVRGKNKRMPMNGRVWALRKVNISLSLSIHQYQCCSDVKRYTSLTDLPVSPWDRPRRDGRWIRSHPPSQTCRTGPWRIAQTSWSPR